MPAPAEITWAELQALFDDEPEDEPPLPLFEDKPE